MALPTLKKLDPSIPWGELARKRLNAVTDLIVDASDTEPGLIETATDAEAIAKSATDKALVPSNLAALDASDSFAGLIEIATDAEFVAMTATDKAIVPSNLAAKPSFLAHKNGTGQTGITSATPIKVTFGTEDWDTGNHFATSTWTPPAGKHRISAAIRFENTNAVDGELLDLRLYKNGAFHRITSLLRGGTSIISVTISVLVDADGNDTFEVYAFKGGAGDGAISGETAYTYFCGEAIA